MSVRRLAVEQPEHFSFTPENLSWLEGQIAKYPEGRQASAVIPALWRAQEQHGGWIPEPAMQAIADLLSMPKLRVLEVATFYTMFNLEPVGRYLVQVCRTTPCSESAKPKADDADYKDTRWVPAVSCSLFPQSLPRSLPPQVRRSEHYRRGHSRRCSCCRSGGRGGGRWLGGGVGGLGRRAQRSLVRVRKSTAHLGLELLQQAVRLTSRDDLSVRGKSLAINDHLLLLLGAESGSGGIFDHESVIKAVLSLLEEVERRGGRGLIRSFQPSHPFL